MSARSEFGCSALEANEVEGLIVCSGLAFLVVGKRIDTIEHCRFLSENHRVLYKILPFNWVELFEVLKKRHAGVLVCLTDNFAQ